MFYQVYSDKRRKNEPHALPDVELWLEDGRGGAEEVDRDDHDHDDDDPYPEALAAGWYFWFCFPGCLPNGEPEGPYPTTLAALREIRSNSDQEV